MWNIVFVFFRNIIDDFDNLIVCFRFSRDGSDRGILGKRSKTSLSWVVKSFNWGTRAEIASFNSAVSQRAFSASSFWPFFIKAPISLAIRFISACFDSDSCWSLRRCSSRYMIFSTDSLASKFFTARRSITVSLFSWINFKI